MEAQLAIVDTRRRSAESKGEIITQLCTLPGGGGQTVTSSSRWQLMRQADG
ncbi:hypothetical protein TRAPUB_13546 [Trametes pubescens]|uniref:Uncharacterized protein n=1 Tax=Trametes pubescens TaxID=154538 RepID=A0A1M2VEA7_TRAPU|nr:hypothetical protein TRAPUB_3273 [Trametes pubescens]OJT06877.1 hypothetical protein TRAPUB_2269 [Trametes pubescens]OJT09974.1 hypothetical protein TRAPUB_13546 [Trametes pubescens]